MKKMILLFGLIPSLIHLLFAQDVFLQINQEGKIAISTLLLLKPINNIFISPDKAILDKNRLVLLENKANSSIKLELKKQSVASFQKKFNYQPTSIFNITRRLEEPKYILLKPQLFFNYKLPTNNIDNFSRTCTPPNCDMQWDGNN